MRALHAIVAASLLVAFASLASAQNMSSASYTVQAGRFGDSSPAMNSTAPSPKIGGVVGGVGSATASGISGSATSLATVAGGYWALPAGGLPNLDSDGDGIQSFLDNCPTVANVSQADGDADEVGDACDNCVDVANARVGSGVLASNPWMTTTGNQRDDDADGYGNVCDGKFPGTPGIIVSGLDSLELLTALGKLRTFDTCGSSGTTPCASFDVDEITVVIGGLDANYYLANLLGKPRGATCPTCPLACEGDNC